MNLKKNIPLIAIFVLAIFLRLLYFPQNTYFGFDQARDAFAVQGILNGDLKIVGPPTANQIFHHGVLYYYIFAPFYFLSGGDPQAVSLFLRVLNALGIFIIFLITRNLFGARIAFLSSFLFAISFEQTQFALFLNHPSLAVISVLIFYLGQSFWIFKRKNWGLILSIFGLGLSIQFEFVETQLIAIFALFLFLFRRQLPELNIKKIVLVLVIFSVPILSYLIAEIRNNFFILRQLPNLFSSNSLQILNNLSNIPFLINRHFQDNILANFLVVIIVEILFLLILVKFVKDKNYFKQLIFLSIWFFGGFLIYFLVNNDAYFYNTGTSIALLIFAAFLLSRFYLKYQFLTVLILSLITVSNLYQITKNNPLGPNQKINPQIGLLLKDEKKVVDFIYQEAKGENFAVNALTMPLNVNTTWSYLFEWYGQKKYGYLPIWGGDAAAGFPGNLKIETARSKLPNKRYLIIEPTQGIPTYLVDKFLFEEQSYTHITGKVQIGALQVWIQQPK